MSEDDSKTFTLIPEKVTHGPIVLLLQLCNSRPHRYANFKFYSLICYYCSSPLFLLLTLAKLICLFLHLMYVNSNLIDDPKTSQGKWEPPPPCVGDGNSTPPQNPKIYLTDLPLFKEACIFRMRFNLKTIFASDA